VCYRDQTQGLCVLGKSSTPSAKYSLFPIKDQIIMKNKRGPREFTDPFQHMRTQ
jgi:hypothetical protein